MRAPEYARRADGTVIDARDTRVRLVQGPHESWCDYTTRGNGERIVDAHRNDLRHAANAGWYDYDGRRWAHDPKDKRALARAMNVLREMHERARATPGIGHHALDFCRASQSPGAWEAALKTASLYAPIATTFDAFDDGPMAPIDHEYRLNLNNGTLDLRTRFLAPHRREDQITKLAPVDYRPDAPAAPWLSFLGRVQPDPEVRSFLQRLAGYWLTGYVRDEVFPIFWGTGGNGKGTFLDTVRKCLGDYAGAIPEQVLISQTVKPHPTMLMVFRGLRLGVASETEEGDHLAISTLKRLTGGDVITARFMGKDFVSFEPTHKIVLMTNARPRLRGRVGPSLKRRIFFVPWGVSFEGGAIDTELKPRLALPDALSGVLNWMVDGFAEWRRIGLAPPRSVLAATADYMEAEDTIAQFLFERCELRAGEEVAADDLYKAYRLYCKEIGELEVSRVQDFKPAFLDKEAAKTGGVEWHRDKRGRWYKNVVLRPKRAEDYESRSGEMRGLWGPS